MRQACFIRKIDELGRIVLPIEIRQQLDIKKKDPLEISINDNGVFLKKNYPVCAFCNSTSELINFFEKNICKNCINKLKAGDFNE